MLIARGFTFTVDTLHVLVTFGRTQNTVVNHFAGGVGMDREVLSYQLVTRISHKSRIDDSLHTLCIGHLTILYIVNHTLALQIFTIILRLYLPTLNDVTFWCHRE